LQGIVFTILALSSLRDHLRALREAGGPGPGAGEAPPPPADAAAAEEAEAAEAAEADAAAAAARFVEEMGLEELVGLNGPVRALFGNAVTVLTSNAVFLIVAAFIPFSAGRCALTLLRRHAWAPAGSLAGWAAALGAPPPAAADASAQPGPVLGGRLAALAAELEAQLAPPPVSDIASLALGYLVLAALAAGWVCVVCAWHVGRRGPAAAASAAAQAAPALARQASAALCTALLLAKVVFLLAAELGAFPLLCGWWLDVCSLRLFGCAARARLEFAQASPLAAAAAHWLAGIGYMLLVSSAVAALRAVLRPAVLAFLRDPGDPAFDPLRDLVAEPLGRHGIRVAASAALYGCLMVALVWTPIAAAAAAAPGRLPLAPPPPPPAGAEPAALTTALLVDAMALQLALPFAAEQLQPRAAARAALRAWVRCVGGALGMAAYLLPGPPEAPPPATPALFAPRVVLLLTAAWASLVAASAAALLAPLELGRRLVAAAAARGRPVQGGDLHAVCAGCCAIALVAGCGAALGRAWTRNRRSLRRLAAELGEAAAAAGARALVLAVAGGALPCCLGAIAYLALGWGTGWGRADAAPPQPQPGPALRLAHIEALPMGQCWAAGLVLLRALARLLAPPPAPPADAGQLPPPPPPLPEWRLALQLAAEEGGLDALPPAWALQVLLLPAAAAAAAALAAPWLLARAACAAAGLSGGGAECGRLVRWAHPACAAACAAGVGLRLGRCALRALHDAVRDERYLVGRRLHNFAPPGGEDVVAGEGHAKTD